QPEPWRELRWMMCDPLLDRNGEAPRGLMPFDIRNAPALRGMASAVCFQLRIPRESRAPQRETNPSISRKRHPGRVRDPRTVFGAISPPRGPRGRAVGVVASSGRGWCDVLAGGT